jgi:hypothetical protein
MCESMYETRMHVCMKTVYLPEVGKWQTTEVRKWQTTGAVSNRRITGKK